METFSTLMHEVRELLHVNKSNLLIREYLSGENGDACVPIPNQSLIAISFV